MSAMLAHGGWRRLTWFANNLGSLVGFRKPPKGLCTERLRRAFEPLRE
jgi:hypothetical protein